MSNRFATAANGCFVREASIEREDGISSACDPDEVIEIGREFMRVGGNKIFLRMTVAKVTVADSEYFERFDGHASLFPNAISRGPHSMNEGCEDVNCGE
jgi:hypothetical protein